MASSTITKSLASDVASLNESLATTNSNLSNFSTFKRIVYEYKTTGLANTSKTVSLESAHAYLVVVTRVNSSNTNGAGIYLVTTQSNNSNIYAIHSSGSATLTLPSSLTLNIAYTTDYQITAVYQLA